MQKYRVRNLTRDTVIGDSIECAGSSKERTRGLLGRTVLAPGEGLWIVPCEGVHTFFMKFALDLIYLDRKHVVRKVVRNVAPWRLSFCLTAHSILELPVGAIDSSATLSKDQLALDALS